jgi:predicted translin family RNA/ssDNA-binding protein
MMDKEKIKKLNRDIERLSRMVAKKTTKKMKKAARVSQEDTLKMLRAELNGLSVWKRAGVAFQVLIGNI